MKRSACAELLAALTLGLLLCGTGCPDGEADRPPPPASDPAPSPSGPPSILLISLDTTRADRLGSYGHDGADTPTLDRLAARGLVFDKALTPVPITLPAHASLLTGRLPRHHGVHDNGMHRLPDDVPTLAEILAGAGYRTGAAIGAAVLDRQYGLDRGFERYDDNVGAFGGLAIPERNATQVTDAALRLADGLTGRFLLFVHYFDPHADYRPPPPFASRFHGRLYEGEIAYVDSELGRLLAGLESRGLLRNTVVLVTGDHGEGLGEHGESTHGVFLYDSTLHIPMILVAPERVAPGRRVSHLVSLTDVLPTLLDLARVAAPAGLDGRSLLALPDPADATATADVWLPLESNFGLSSYGWAPLVGLTDGRLKWIGAPTAELYDLVADPREQDNLAAARPADVERLARRLARDWPEERVAPPPSLPGLAAAEQLEKLESLGYVSAPGRRAGDLEGLPDPKDVIGTLAQINAARGEMGAGRAREAARILEPVVRRTPGNVSALILLGSSRILSGAFAEAVPPLRRAAGLAPHKADVHYNLGIALMNSGDADGAEQAWRQALAVSPRYLEAAANLVDLLQTSARPAEAQELLDRARGAGLEGPVLDYLDGRLALERGERQRAAASLRRALAGPLPPALADDARALLRAAGS